MRRLQVDLSGLWRCVEQMGDPMGKFMREEEETMQATYRGRELLELSGRHGLDVYAFGGQHPFVVIGARPSIEHLMRQMDELEELKELLLQSYDALEEASHHWISDTMMRVLDDLHPVVESIEGKEDAQ